MTKSVLILTFIALVTGLGAADTLEVGPSDSDAEYNSIQAALAEAVSSDDIVLREGTYELSNNINIDNLTIRGPNSDIPGSSENREQEARIHLKSVDLNSDNVTFEGLLFEQGPFGDKTNRIEVYGTNTTFENNFFEVPDDDAPFRLKEGADDAFVSSNEFDGSGGNWIVNVRRDVNEPIDGVEIRDNVFRNSGDGVVQLKGLTNAVVEDNQFVDLNSEAIRVAKEVDGTVIRDNQITNKGLNPDFKGAAGIVINGATGQFEISENEFDQNPYHIVQFSGEEPSLEDNQYDKYVRVDDSTSYIAGSLQPAIDLAPEGSEVEISHGTYESATVDTQGLTLKGPKAGTSGESEARTDEAIIEGSVTIDAAGTTLNGVKLESSTEGEGRGIKVKTGNSVTVKNTIVEGFKTGASHDFASEEDPSSITYANNLFVGNVAGIGSTEGVSGLTIENTVFDSNTEGIGLSATDEISEVLAGDVTVYDLISNKGNEFVNMNLEKGDRAVSAYKDVVSFDSEGNLIVDEDPERSYEVPGTSIQDAVDFAREGDTIKVASGTYEEEVELAKSLTVQPVDGENPVVESTETPFTVKSNGVTIRDMTIRGVENSGNGIEVRPQLEKVDIKGNSIENLKRDVLVGLQDLNNAASVEIDNNTIEQNEFGVAQANTDSVSIVNNTFRENSIEAIGSAPVDGSPEIRRNSFLENGVAVKYYGVEGETNVAVDATRNYWGQESGPEEGQTEGDVEYTPWMLTSDGQYDQLETVPAGTWTPVSAEASSENTEIAQLRSDEDAQILSYSEGNWTQANNVPTGAALRSFYAKTDNKATVGFDHASDGDNPENVRSAQLSEGWNTIGVATSEDETVSDQLSVLSGTLNTLFIPYQGTDLPNGSMIDGSNLPGGQLNEDDGYWVNLQENKVYSVLG